MRLCIAEDNGSAGLEPLSLTRPVFDLLCGATSLAAKQARFFRATPAALFVRPHLRALTRLQYPGVSVNDPEWLGQETTVVVNGRWLPSAGLAPNVSTPVVATVGDQVAYAVVPAGARMSPNAEGVREFFAECLRRMPLRLAGGQVVRHPWDLVAANADAIRRDWEAAPPPPQPGGIHVVGPADRVHVAPSARVDPLVVADTWGGPVLIDEGAVVTAFTRLEGPCVIGPRSHVLGAKVRAGTTLGPECRVGGEVEASILQGYSNKYHDGFLGHAYLGEWVNLGAGTQNSDLRNDYGEVRVPLGGQPTPTGQTKVGCFVGDHTKTGLNTLFNTGTCVGAFCNLLPGGGYLPKYVPSFASWWNGRLMDPGDLPAALETAEKVMARRGVPLTDAHRHLYEALHRQTADERRRALWDAERKRLGRIA